MVVDNGNIMQRTVGAPKANTLLIVHTNAVLPRPIPLQLFEPIAGWYSEFVQRHRRIQLDELAQHAALQRRRVPANQLPREDTFAVSIGEVDDRPQA